MRMGINQNLLLGAMLREYVEDFLHRPALFAAGKQLPVGIGPCATLAETIVGVGVNGIFTRYARHVGSPLLNVFPALKHNGPNPLLYQSKRGEKPGRTGPHHHGLRSPLGKHIILLGTHNRCGVRRLVNPYPHRKVDHHAALTGINGAPHNSMRLHTLRSNTGSLHTPKPQRAVGSGRARVNSKLKLLHHCL